MPLTPETKLCLERILQRTCTVRRDLSGWPAETPLTQKREDVGVVALCELPSLQTEIGPTEAEMRELCDRFRVPMTLSWDEKLRRIEATNSVASPLVRAVQDGEALVVSENHPQLAAIRSYIKTSVPHPSFRLVVTSDQLQSAA